MTTTRRNAMSVLLGLGYGSAVCGSALGEAAWRAYEAVEEAWIRDRHALIVEQCPDCSEAAGIDLELKLAELHRRSMQFQHMSKAHPQQLRGGMWQLSWIPIGESDLAKLGATNLAYRKQDEKVRKLAQDLRRHRNYDDFQRAQTRLWKTPEYRAVHRRYSGRLQELNLMYSGNAVAASL